ncbi:sugar kinase [candidate division NPL-UPA2 bacterium Unc8]|uniref:Sugar kinase n=1 Tax=candidate division NPL-UPA2 bacterium Unc8 TaxID=1980939 RepID=A0A399FVG6_UNCN2|nr:MAG: sugar kinase [candidate division NPL-UPA2 bacterium Unc8]
MSILVVGSVALDTVKTPRGEVKDALGGSAIYFAISASYFSPVNLCAVVGNDFPEEHLNLLKSRSIDLAGLEIKKGDTFRWKARYGENLNERETLLLCLNVFKDFHPILPRDYRLSKTVFLANIDPELHLSVLRQLDSPKLVVGDTMNIWIEKKFPSLQRTLSMMDIFIVNDEEAKMLTGEDDLVASGRKLLSLGPRIAVIKRGEYGAALFTKSSYFPVPAYSIKTVCDPTGAGDSFAGGFLGYLEQCGSLSENALRNALVYGSVMASFTIEGFSLDCLRTITNNDIKKRYKELSGRVK